MLYTRKNNPRGKLNWVHVAEVAGALAAVTLLLIWAFGGFSGGNREGNTAQVTATPETVSTATSEVQPATQTPASAATATAEPSTPAPTETPLTGKETVTLGIAGDILLDGNVTGAGESGRNRYDFAPFYEKIAEDLQKTDFTIGTLEAPVVDGVRASDYPRANAPKAFLEALAKAGFDMVNLATNHALDQGAEGVGKTEEAVESVEGLAATGTVNTQGAFLQGQKLKIAVLGYTVSSEREKETFAASVRELTKENVEADVKKARENGAKVIVALVHWGTEKAAEVSAEMKEQAQMLADAGIDVVAGSNVRRLLPAAMLKGRDDKGQEKDCLVAYSLGSFLTNALEMPYDTSVLVRLTLTYDFDADKLSVEIREYLPTWTLRYSNNGKYHFEVLPAAAWQDKKHTGIGRSQRARLTKAVQTAAGILGEDPLKLAK
ncbi:MAG: CapA family protein [Clostridia bacterium]|nr:CapA family protein [Clostridia bacterium]